MTRKNLYIGILSGTSMDSIDCGIFCFDNHKCQLIYFTENIYPTTTVKSLKKLVNSSNIDKNFKKLQINLELSEIYGEIVNKTIKKSKLSKNQINAIGMHGQTVSHEMGKHSIQIGCPKTLSDITNIIVVSDFRQDDILNGGSGAPLAPLFHNYSFRKLDKKRVIVNIGGIANISFLSNKNNENVYGFDSGPGNTLIDVFARKKFNLKYDVDGKISSDYKFSKKLLKILLDDKFFKLKPPKSTSTEYFSYDWVSDILKVNNINISDGDLLATLSELTSLSIINSISEIDQACDEIYICGGGAFNKSIMKSLKKYSGEMLHENVTLDTVEKLNISSKHVETGLFAWLAKCKIENEKLDYTKITGSEKPIVIGRIS